MSAGVFVVGTEVGWSDQWAANSRDVVAKPSTPEEKSEELTTDLDHDNCFLYRFSLRVIELEY